MRVITFALLSALVCLAAAVPNKKIADDATTADETTHTVALADVKKVDIRRSLSLEAEEGPLNVTLFDENPCEATRNFNYYVAYPGDSGRYIQCNPWGTGMVRKCLHDTEYNMWSLACDLPANIHNMTLVLPHRVFNCSMSSHQECANGGVCTESSLGGDRCVCKPEWTGPTCESRLDVNDLVHDILNNTFSIKAYRQHIAALNITVDVAQYERYKDQLDNTTFRALMAYMSLYKGTEVRYDTLINQLVENILENIYPDAAYLSQFNSSAVSVVDLVQLIPNLMSYSKYSVERYTDVFAKYQQVLASLITYLNGTHNSHPHLRQEAAAYSRLTGVFMNQTLALANQTATSTFTNSENINSLMEPHTGAAREQQSEQQIRDSLRAQFNATLNATRTLYLSLATFQAEVTRLVQKGDKDIFALTIEDSKLNGTAGIQELLEQISTSSVQIWDQLVNYGFWYITSLLTTPVDVIVKQTTILIQKQVEIAAKAN